MFKLLLVLGLILISPLAFGHGMSPEDQARMLNANFMEYISLGATHMLTGYDHLLFLFGVMFFLTKFSSIVKFITAFTVGHSITLIFATLLGIKINYFLIDAVIALTVCYKAFDNLNGFKRYLNTNPPSLIWMVFGFGLIHGFGLSTRLQELPLGTEGLVAKILAFNVGVELGQIVALAVMLALLTVWRKRESFTKFAVTSNVSLMVAGLFLLAFQLHGYAHTKYTDDFPMNKDDHFHTHQDMALAIKKSASSSSEVLSNSALTGDASSKDFEHSHDGSNYHSHVDNNAEEEVPAVSVDNSYDERLHPHDGENYHIDSEVISEQEPEPIMEQETYDESAHRHGLGDYHSH